MREQNATTRGYFSGFAASRAGMRARLEELQNFERAGCIMERGPHAYAHRNTGLQNQDVLFQLPAGAADAAAAPADLFSRARALLDLNTEYPAGTTALGTSAFSECGKFFAYALSSGGSDWQTIHVRSVETGADLPERLSWAKFGGIAWLHDSSGFFYSRFPPPAALGAAAGGAKEAGTETGATVLSCVFFHALGTPQEADLLVYACPAQPVWLHSASVTDDGRYLLLSTAKGTDPVQRLFVSDLAAAWAPWRAAAAPTVLRAGEALPPLAPGGGGYLPMTRLIDNFAASWDYVANDGARFYFVTNLDAKNYRLVALDVPPQAAAAASSEAAAVPAGSAAADGPTPPVFDVVPESPTDVLSWGATFATSYVMLCYLADVADELRVLRLPDAPPPLPAAALPAGAASPARIEALVTIPLPAPGTLAGVACRRELPRAFVKFVSFLAPGTLLKLEVLPAGAPASAPAGPGFEASVALPGGTTARVTTYRETRVPGFAAEDYEAVKEMVPSTDGTVRVPVFLVRKKRAPDAPAAPANCLLYGESRGAARRHTPDSLAFTRHSLPHRLAPASSPSLLPPSLPPSAQATAASRSR